ncbi:nucleoside phosphorylase [Enterobacter sp.]|uniref:phosphorylase family protein n=1 Tax=Enterobacter sp. TaxID=42895 RepID=UPI00296EEEA3|nr:nucleoside phosphorylase [Enterobacter sp.]
MMILILEDQDEKLEKIKQSVFNVNPVIEVQVARDYATFIKLIHAHKFDLIISDLLVPRINGEDDLVDISSMLTQDAMDVTCVNLYTRIVAFTQYADADKFTDLNNSRIIVISYSETNDWRNALEKIILECKPSVVYDFIIICALEKESQGFNEAGYIVGPNEIINELHCKKISINEKHGLIITCPRMGLITASIISTKAIEYFKPKLICMSGICAGIASKVNIYDVVIPQICHQHDFGKWGADGFEPEAYSVQLNHKTSTKIQNAISDKNFIKALIRDLVPKRSELPDGTEELNPVVKLAPASSGSAVIADENMNLIVKNQHRKMTAFEMETFSVYESARLANVTVDFFSAKCIVDDGGINKSDNYHRLACILSAKTVYQLIEKCY